MFWYVLFVKTGNEFLVEKYIKKMLDIDVCIPFVPLHEIIFKKNGYIKKELRPLFPGYLFVESNYSSQKFIEMMKSVVSSSRHVIKVLSYSNTEYEMRKCEKQMLMNLCNEYYCIELSTGVINGRELHILDGPLKGAESVVKKLNRHKRTACIELDFMGSSKLITVGLEIISKVKFSEKDLSTNIL